MDKTSKKMNKAFYGKQESLKSGSNFLHEKKAAYDFEKVEESNLNHQNYVKLKEVAEGILSERYRYMKLQAPGFMDLVIERIWDNRISLSHYYEQNGDLMADPDMEVIVDQEKEEIKAATFQQDNMGIYQSAYKGDDLKDGYLASELDHFLNQWLSNISIQGYIPCKAYYSSELGEVRFDTAGQEIEPDLEEDDLEM